MFLLLIKNKTYNIGNRVNAINKAIQNSSPCETILIAGKGHEQNVVLADSILPYNERAFVGEIYQAEIQV